MKTKLCSLTTRLLTLFAFAYLLSVGRGLAQVYEEVFSFGDARAEDFANGPHKGRAPSAALLQAADGNFYGTLRYGTVFKMTADGVLTTVVEFTGTSGSYKGSEPNAVMVRGSNGNLYGTTSRGGAANFGTVFTMTATGVLTTLVEFTSGNNLGNVDHFVGLVQGSDGNFYGTTSDGGAFCYGTVFKMTATGVLTTLVEFTHNGATNRGSKPLAGLVEGSDGNFYGTTSEGGPLPFGSGDGTVFKVTPAGRADHAGCVHG